MFKARIYFLLGLALSIAAATPSHAHEVKQIGPGVWAGQGVAASGEVVYFGLELLDKDNSLKWRRYIEDSIIMSRTQALQNREDPTIKDAVMGEKDDQKYKDEKSNLFAAVVDGARAFSHTADGRRYVAYASKKPIVGKFAFPGQSLSGYYKDLDGGFEHPIRIRDFEEVYGDLVMSVGVHDLVNSPKYENRGIFRNPLSMARRDYKGLAMSLHGFTAAAASKVFKGKKYLSVAPMLDMHKILCRSLKSEQMYIKKNMALPYRGFPPIPDDLRAIDSAEAERCYLDSIVEAQGQFDKFSKKMINRDGDCALVEYDPMYSEREHLIKVDALIQLYEGRK